jgi:prevent-host-death family protein
MKEIAAATFKEQCLSLLDAVDPDGIVITRDGKPVAKLVPIGSDSPTPGGSPDRQVRMAGKAVSSGLEWGC